MSQLQRLSPWPLEVQERDDDGANVWVEARQATLLAQIFSRNGRQERVRIATPPGYSYIRESVTEPLLTDTHGPIMQVAAHPGDGPDFFYATYLKMAEHAPHRVSYHEILLTDGEGGVEGWHPERTRSVRIKEAYAGAEIVGSRLHFLSYPDGSLAALENGERERLVARLAQEIGDIQPALLIVHPPKDDHPDHAHSFLLTLAALRLNAQAGGRLPALYVHDVEFGLQQRSLWTLPTGDTLTELYPMHAPGLIVDISSTHSTAQYALQQHQTQMSDPLSGQPKLYADLIDILAQVRGLQFAPEEAPEIPRGQGFSQIVIPGVTSEHAMLSSRLPAGSCYWLRKND